jgi:hypothetical protein
LFPALLDDHVAEDNPVRAVNVFVDGLDLDKLGFVGVQPLDTCRPGYHPRVMLKLYIYGYLNRVPDVLAFGQPAFDSVNGMGHMPSSHCRYADWTIGRIRRDAALVGPATAALCELSYLKVGAGGRDTGCAPSARRLENLSKVRVGWAGLSGCDTGCAPSDAHCVMVRELRSPKPSVADWDTLRQRRKPLSENVCDLDTRSPNPLLKVFVIVTENAFAALASINDATTVAPAIVKAFVFIVDVSSWLLPSLFEASGASRIPIQTGVM